ncbi:MAG: hypothetical protein ACRDHO_08335 [Actinomycetota bacterium]
MSEAVEVLRVDWDRLRRIRLDASDRELGAELLRRGAALSRASEGESDEVERLRLDVVHRAALVAVHRFTYATGRERFREAEEREEESYRRQVKLEREVVPPLRAEAGRLRARLKTLEAEARSRGIDTTGIEPHINWPMTISVEPSEPQRWETPEASKARLRGLFRRRER